MTKNVSWDGIFITNPTNISYLTGFSCLSPRDAYVLKTKEAMYLFIHPLYRQEAKNTRADTVIELSATTPIWSALQKVYHGNCLAYEGTDLTVAEYTSLTDALPDVSLINEHRVVEQQREQKRSDEINNIKKAAEITDACFAFILKRIRPGVSERRLAFDIEQYLRIYAGAIAFPPIVAFSSHAALPHYRGGSNDPLRNNAVILLDFGAKVNGYCADMSRTVFLKTPTDTVANAYACVLSANTKAIAALSVGVRTADIDAAARAIITGSGYPTYPHATGHGVGLDIHESPRISETSTDSLQPSMIVTIEPGIYIEGAYGIRIEDLLVVHANRTEKLSKSQTSLTVI